MIEDSAYEKAEEMLIEYLTKNKLRKSTERFEILKHIYAYKTRFTPEELHERINREFRVSLTTVYNNLDFFVRCNLVIRHAFGTQATQYEKTIGATAKHFLICTECGKVSDFSDKHFKAMLKVRKFRNFEMKSYSLYISGKCKQCRKQKKK